MDRNIHVLGIDPGGTTGWCRLTIPTASIFPFGGKRIPGEIVEWDYGTFTGPEWKQAIDISRLAREIQSLSYLVGPAIVTEAWDQDPKFKSTDPETLSPVRINAQLELLLHQKLLWECTLTQQSRTMAMTTMTDDRLRDRGLYVSNDHIRSATKHAITILRRTVNNLEMAEELWPNVRRLIGNV